MAKLWFSSQCTTGTVHDELGGSVTRHALHLLLLLAQLTGGAAPRLSPAGFDVLRCTAALLPGATLQLGTAASSQPELSRLVY